MAGRLAGVGGYGIVKWVRCGPRIIFGWCGDYVRFFVGISGMSNRILFFLAVRTYRQLVRGGSIEFRYRDPTNFSSFLRSVQGNARKDVTSVLGFGGVSRLLGFFPVFGFLSLHLPPVRPSYGRSNFRSRVPTGRRVIRGEWVQGGFSILRYPNGTRANSFIEFVTNSVFPLRVSKAE